MDCTLYSLMNLLALNGLHSNMSYTSRNKNLPTNNNRPRILNNFKNRKPKGLAGRAETFQEADKFAGRKRLAKEVTLKLVTPVLIQEIDLIFGFDTFGNHL